MKAENPNFTTGDVRPRATAAVPGCGTAASGVSRRVFLNVGLAAASVLALTGCTAFRGSQGDLDKATIDLRDLLDGFEGDAARQARLASIGHRIENRCREVIELKTGFTRRLDALSRRRETSSAELIALVEDFSVHRVKYREELFGVQDELRQALTREEWDQVFG